CRVSQALRYSAFLLRNVAKTLRSAEPSTHEPTALNARRWRLSLVPQNSCNASTVAYSSTIFQRSACWALVMASNPSFTGSTAMGCAALAPAANAPPASNTIASQYSWRMLSILPRPDFASVPMTLSRHEPAVQSQLCG